MIPPGLWPPRAPETHKGDAGRVLVIAGSVGYSGAAALSAMGALRAGAGLVTLAIPEDLHDPLAAKLTEAMLRPLAQTPQGSLSLKAQPAILKLVGTSDVVALGPGLSQHPQTQALIRRLVPKIAKPLVVDADGLNALAGHLTLLRTRAAPTILTPHPGEMSRLIGRAVEAVPQERTRTAQAFASQRGVIVVLKGHHTVVADATGAVFVNETGNPGMASGGCGDVLTGLIAGLIGQRLSPFDAARLGVHLHGSAGDLAAVEVGRIGLLASDLAARIPQAIRRYQSLA